MSVRVRSAHRKIGRVLALAVSAKRREWWRRERFWARARRHTPVIEVLSASGNRYLTYTSDEGVGRELFVRGEFDPVLTENVLSVLRQRGFEPEQIVDVGANLGTVTIDLLKRFPAGKGVAIEPDAGNLRLLRQNVLGNQLSDRVDIVAAAISDYDGTADFELSPDNMGDHRVRLGPAARGDFGEHLRATQAVPVMRLDTLVEQGRISAERRTLIWIDVQGLEAHVIAGATRLLDSPIVMEFWPYALRRAGTYERMLEQLAAWPQIYEVRERLRAVDTRDIAGFAAEVEARPRTAFTDVLLVPPRGRPG